MQVCDKMPTIASCPLTSLQMDEIIDTVIPGFNAKGYSWQQGVVGGVLKRVTNSTAGQRRTNSS